MRWRIRIAGRRGSVNQDAIDTLFRQVRLDPFHRSERIIDFHDQLPVPIIMELDDDGARGVVHVPKDTLPMLVKLARCDNAGKVRTYEPDAIVPRIQFECYEPLAWPPEGPLDVGINNQVARERMVLHVRQSAADPGMQGGDELRDGVHSSDNDRRNGNDHLVHQLEGQKVGDHPRASLNHQRADPELREMREQHAQIEQSVTPRA
jgi:hypothetical protein